MKPVLQALVLAERVYTDEVSGAKIIAGTFSQILMRSPSVVKADEPGGQEWRAVYGSTDMGSPWAYVSLTDVVYGTEIVLEMVDITRNVVLLRSRVPVRPADRLDTVEVVIPLPPLRLYLNRPGTYAFEVVWRDEILGSHRVVVREIQQKSDSDSSGAVQGADHE